MIDFLQKGGPFVWVLLGCSLVATAVFLERASYYHRVTIRVGDLLRGLSNLIALGNFSEAVTECAATPGPAARVMHAVLLKYDLPREELKDIAQDAGQLEMPGVERNLGLLSAIVYIAPLVGLLGTVVGLLQTFLTISAVGGYATTPEIASGIYQSLIATAGGLAIAIPSMLAYQYLSSRVNDLVHDMERAGIEVVSMIVESRRRAANESTVPKAVS